VFATDTPETARSWARGSSSAAPIEGLDPLADIEDHPERYDALRTAAAREPGLYSQDKVTTPT
jgi:hypothetical protein